MSNLDFFWKALELSKSVSDRVNFKKFSIWFSWAIIILSVFLSILTLGFYLFHLDYGDRWRFFWDVIVTNKLALLIILSVISTYLIFWIGWNIIYEFCYLQRAYNCKPKNLVKDWEFQGILRKKDGCLELSYSDSGCILKKRRWRDFEMKFDFKIPNKEKDRGFGLIIRADDLENYIILKLDDVITPHIRQNKFWEIISPQDCQLIIVDGKWHSCKLEIIENQARIYIDEVVEYHYNLPTHSGISANSLRSVGININENPGNPNIAGKIECRNFGTVGFRAWGYQSPDTESVEIRKLEIKRKLTWNSVGLE